MHKIILLKIKYVIYFSIKQQQQKVEIKAKSIIEW
jgi:hypothetical protein